MKWPWWKKPEAATREHALGEYLRFMEGCGGNSFTFPKGAYSADQICRDVEGIILRETEHMADKPWRERLHEFQRRRGMPWPRA